MTEGQPWTWHLSTGYLQPWGVYCGARHRRGVDFRTFDLDHVTCGACRAAAAEAWAK